MPADQFGLTQQHVAHLIARRQKLESLLQIAEPHHAAEIHRRINHIDKILAQSGWTGQRAAVAAAQAASGVDGIGGLEFTAQAPPGVGRLVRLPFYPTVGNTTGTGFTITAGGVGLPSSTNPVMIEVPAAGQTSPGAHGLVTPQISWATLRLVGFETAQKRMKGTSETGPIMLCADLQIGGGANLFTHEEFADATVYDANQPEFTGLRDYPPLKSPNFASVTVQMVGDLATYRDTFSCALLCEVLVDDNYGAHIPGAYARRGALVRQGGAFAS